MKLKAENSIAILVDIQEKLSPHMFEYEELVKNSQIILKGLKLFNIPIIANEQYPQGLGHLIEPLKNELSEEEINEKNTFSCCAVEQTKQKILDSKKSTAIVFGIETHICVLQTCLDLISCGITPVLVVDCCSSRKQKDKDIAISRMIQAGVIPTTYESLLFEFCGCSKHEAFKSISKLIK